MMAEIKASLNNLRMAPRKVRLAANLIKGMSVARAKAQLAFLIRKP
ncbi:uL22 family ribosomal protein, partial [Patescibacteria group bacterium]|nr:uL22 family ribosomal protein [Patescibacteria group bacterium]